MNINFLKELLKIWWKNKDLKDSHFEWKIKSDKNRIPGIFECWTPQQVWKSYLRGKRNIKKYGIPYPNKI